MASNAELPDVDRSHPLDPHDEPRVTNELHTDRTGKNTVLNQYERLQRIGTGQHGEVYVAIDSNNKTTVAIKGMKRKNAREDKMKLLRKSAIQASPHTPLTDRMGTAESKIRKEIAIMKKCRHAHVVRLLEVIDDRMKHKIYMVMEYLGGGEIKWRNMNHEPILHVDQTRRICRDAILGLEYLHYQGIIHRDIKPANLLWTDDRQQVKISDFGVSHFSVALRMAAVGPGLPVDSQSDATLMDERELSKRAGTPSFLAPEVIYEYSKENLPNFSTADGHSSGDSESTKGSKPESTLRIALSRGPVTKSIDVWALGVTLYCLLFGQVPFQYSGDNAFRTYVKICNSDWDVLDYMGFDQIPTHKIRYPPAANQSEAAVITRILDKMLQKDARNRMTLDEFKCHPWITRGIPDVAEWLHDTSPSKNDMVIVTDFETESAMSSVHTRRGWHQRIKHQLSSILHNVRPHRSSRSMGQAEVEKFGSDSAPHLEGGRSKPRTKRLESESHKKGKKGTKANPKDKGKGVDPREKGKGRAKDISKATRNELGNTIASTSTGQSRRGSGTLLLPDGSERVSHSPRTSSPTSSRTGDDHPFSSRWQGTDSARKVFSVRSLTGRWRPHKSTSYESTPPEASTSTISSSVESYIHDVSSGNAQEHLSDTGRMTPVNPPQRSASWGGSGVHHTYIESLSIGSGGDEEPIGKDVIMHGAGGVAAQPSQGMSTPVGYTIPTPATSAVSSARHAPPDHLLLNSSIQPTPDPLFQDRNFARQVQAISQTSSPLAHMTYDSDVDLTPSSSDGSDEDSLGDVVEGRYQDGSYPGSPSRDSGHIYEEGEDDSDEENVPLEVKRRRPSVTAP